MAFDWSLVTGTLVGAVIGLTGDWTGRLSARRQTAAAHRQARADAEVDRQIQREEDMRRAVEAREVGALQTILAAMTSSLPGVTRAREHPDDAKAEVTDFVRLTIFESVQVVDEGLRRRLEAAADALDHAVQGHLATFVLGECIYTVRQVLRGSIGARLRGEAVPRIDSEDWPRLMREAAQAQQQWKEANRRQGFDASSPGR